MKATFRWAVLLLFVGGCKKDGEAPIVDQAATFILHHPFNNTNVKSGVEVLVDAYMKDGKVDDYSHLDYYVINNQTDTIARGKLDKKGLMITHAANLPKGRNDIHAVAIDSRYPDKIYKTETAAVYVCDQPAVTVSYEKDRNSITVKWTKAMVGSFKSYDVYVTRTDTMNYSTYVRGKKLASITDVDQTTYRDATVDFYYEYAYEVVVASTDGCGSGSNRTPIEAGLSIPVPDPDNGKPLFARTNLKWYKLKAGTDKDTILVIDAHTLATESKVAIDHITGVNNSLLQVTGNALLVLSERTPTIKIQSMDLGTLAVQPLLQFDHTGPVSTKAVAGDRVVVIQQDIAYELEPATGNKYALPQGQALNAWAIDQNTYLVASKQPTDSFYVYRSNAAAAPTIVAKVKYNNQQQAIFEEMFTAAGKTILGVGLYDASFNELHAFSDPLTGISNDGSLLTNVKGQIIRAADFSVVSNNGDVRFGTTYFSADNKSIYPVTTKSTVAYPNRAPRFYSYPWEK
ncbi:hypothetical protein [Paraflavitalea sp. CAU 1676]|uniref:hypothetical protein n=1 Tax=Paraflavitalea sp. CAU 1676 TaxID=3032598 RepID=UPI0023DC7376|nr:hypothetical protein [Paraflavitalea sp. CAU 1676]MDF2192452.1 hypothetical protein [Paraflavitalea sp. CAU 1676]